MPIEVHVLFALFFVFSLFSLLIIKFNNLGFGDLTFHLDHSLLFGSAIFSILSIVSIYGFFKILFVVFNLIKNKDNAKSIFINIGKKLLIYIRSLAFWTLLIVFLIVIYSYALEFVYRNADPGAVASTSEYLMHLDYLIFGVYPPFFLQKFAAIGSIGFLSVLAYRQILFIISVVVLTALFTNSQLLRKFIISFIIAGFIGLPFWTLIPAISPAEMYVVNTLGRPVPENINYEIKNTKIEKNIDEYLPHVLETWIDPTLKSFAVSTFPSMHVAWGVIAVVIGIELFTPYAIFLLPWLFFNILGTVTTFQHYAVDSLFGILVAVLALFIAKKCLEFESQYFKDDYKLMSVWHMLERDARKTLLFTSKIVK